MSDDLVPAELAGTYARLQNWGRWAFEHRKRGHAASAEGRYRPKWGNNLSSDEEAPARGGQAVIDPWDAQLVGKCLAPAGGFPYRAFLLLKLVFFYRANPYYIARHMAVRQDDYPGELRKALFSARNALEKQRIAA